MVECGRVGASRHVEVSANGSGSSSPTRRRGAHSSGGKRLYRQRSFHLPASATSVAARVHEQTPHPYNDESIECTVVFQPLLKSEYSNGKTPAIM